MSLKQRLEMNKKQVRDPAEITQSMFGKKKPNNDEIEDIVQSKRRVEAPAPLAGSQDQQLVIKSRKKPVVIDDDDDEEESDFDMLDEGASDSDF